MKILNTKISPVSFTDLSELMGTYLRGNEQIKISKSNGEFLIRAYQDRGFQTLLNDSDLNIPDGVGVLWSARYLSIPVSSNKFVRSFQSIGQMLYSGLAIILRPSYVREVIPERLSGIEVFYAMLESCIASDCGVFFFGAREEVLEKSVEIIRKRYPKLKISGYAHGYGGKGEEVITKINGSGARLLIVALGSPEQEQWISDNLAKLTNVRVAVGEGGSFDAIVGVVPRAPKFLQMIGLEWLWRMIFAKNLTTGAANRWKRVWNAVPVFIYEVVKWKIKYGSTEVK